MAPGLPRNCVGPRPLDCGACRTWRHHAALRAGPAYRGRSVCAKSIRLEPSGLILPKALNRVADSRDDACAKIDEPGVADEWLMIPVVDQLVASGRVLGPARCYSYRILPVLGGSYKAEDRVLLPIQEHFGA